MSTENNRYIDFEGFDRRNYPPGIVSVTNQIKGGDATLIFGKEKTALHDCGMAYAGKQIVDNLKEALGGRPLDYILVSHTHYDHIGAMPYIREAFPEAKTVGSAHAQYVFTRPGALNVIRELGIAASVQYGDGDAEKIITDNMSVDIVMKDYDELDLGERKIVTLETKGHTDCGMTYIIEPDSIMIMSESTGICVGPQYTSLAILKSYDDSMESLKKCRDYGAKTLISPHFGVLPQDYNEGYWKSFEKAACEEKEYVVGMWNAGLSPEEMLKKATEEVYNSSRGEEQPYEAFVANCKAIFKVYEEYADADKKYTE